MMAVVIVMVVFFSLTFAAWRRYLWVTERAQQGKKDTCPYSLTDVFDDRGIVNVPHQEGVQWLTDIFSRSAKQFPDHTALQVPHTGELLTFAELDERAEAVAVALSAFLTGPDQVVAVAMTQDNWQIVAGHLGILKAGGTVMFLDTTLPEALITHMLEDAQPAVILTRGQENFRDLPTLDILAMPETSSRRVPPSWLDDPTQRLATIFYTSGTTGMPKGVECAHAGYVNLALSYADYFDLTPGIDATSLTSSLGYDGSISEMYSAWVSGCAVVLLTKEQVRSGPDLVPVLREAEVTVLFCPPVLLTTLTPTPEQDLPYPLCRYVVPAGEAFPAALVEPWTRGRRQIINTYGPTEASTDTSRQSLQPGEPVTIGPPLANVTYVILEVDKLDPLPHGEIGELCIGGVHLARGYRNLPELSTQKFITHPQFGRLYRTGDKCSIDVRTQRVHFLGRIDTQLKVRGHRVETQPVEDILQTQFSAIEAAVLDYQNEELVAFVLAPSVAEGEISVVAQAPAQWAARITKRLSDQLPEPSVPTRIFLVEAFVMKPVSGKIDRERLPVLSDLLLNAASAAEGPLGGCSTKKVDGEGTPKADSVETSDAAEVLAICREVFDPALARDDIFADHGGHSIVIARLAFRLREAGWLISVPALLTDCNTAGKVADCPRERPQRSGTAAASSDSKRGKRSEHAESDAEVLSIGYFTTLQVLFLLLLYSPHLVGFIGLVAFAEIGEFFVTAQLGQFIAAGFLTYLLALTLPFVSLIWVMLIKLCLGAHFRKDGIKPGIYHKWSAEHLRIWCITRLQLSVLRPLNVMFRSAPLMAWVLRGLGATVGKNVHCAHAVEFSGPLGILSIEDDVTIQTGAYLSMSMWVGQDLHVGPVHLESGCKIGMRAAVANHVTVGRGSWITPLTCILDDVGAEEMWEGAPARFAGSCMTLKRPAKHCRYAFPAWIMGALGVLLQVFLDFWLLVVPTASVAWFTVLFFPAEESVGSSDYFQSTPLLEIVWHMGLYAFVTTWVTVVLVCVVGCLFLRCTPASPGLYPSHGLKANLLLYRAKMMDQIQRLWTWSIFGQYLRSLAGVRFTHTGASECDAMFNFVPELIRADSQVFWSHGCYTNLLDQGAEHMTLRSIDMPANSFLGNNCVAEHGQLPSNFLLGVSTPASDIRFRRQMRSRLGESITVVGNPPVQFGSADFELENEAQRPPSLPIFLARVALHDIFSVGILPIAEVLVYAILYTILLSLGGHAIVSACLALVLAEFALVGFCALLKKLIVGTQWGRSHSTPFWSLRHFTYFIMQDCFFAWCGRSMRTLAGTVLANRTLRLMGCRIGKRTIIGDPLQAFDWNAVSLGDDCTMDGMLQLHTFENMQLKVKRTEIRDGSTVNFGATVMGGAIIERDTTLLPMSLVLKEMHLPTATYEGSPTEPRSENQTTDPEDVGLIKKKGL
ncbi:MAG: AMP-binding protein [Verrucomicrobiales bacterium]|nr:AMP-binding protein [Verrucomicrobiales bacterium]